ncbi:hypothetical protein ACXYTD_07945 [Staphylococcus hominis]|uniref:hypothetical protein n=1 Tax=Staphylococcus TaxID=1279 RepID=UPI00066D4AB4|nr:hypothetical protein [Staphylococcus hominis]PTK34084.1 hypothetical protein BUZ47_01185 [Staphylococcus hominis]
MLKQTEFVDNLKKRMNLSMENSYYLESITCSYAIIENRVKKIVLHLNMPANRSLYKNTRSIYNKLYELNTMTDKKERKILRYIKYRLKKYNLLDVDENLDFDNWYSDKNNYKVGNKLINFRIDRNNLTHDLATFDDNNPEIINFNDYLDLAYMGKEVADELCRISSNIKKMKNSND